MRQERKTKNWRMSPTNDTKKEKQEENRGPIPQGIKENSDSR